MPYEHMANFQLLHCYEHLNVHHDCNQKLLGTCI